MKLDKTKLKYLFLGSIILAALVFSLNENTAQAGSGSNDRTVFCDKRGSSRTCRAFLSFSPPNRYQLWLGGVSGDLEGHGNTGANGGRGAVSGCINDSGAMWTGSCQNFYDQRVGDGQGRLRPIDIDIGLDYTQTFRYFVADWYVNDATWNGNMTIEGRKLEIFDFGPASTTVTQGVDFPVSWNVEHSDSTTIGWGGANISCDDSNVGWQGTTNCRAGIPGTGQVWMIACGPKGWPDGRDCDNPVVDIQVNPPAYPTPPTPSPGAFSFNGSCSAVDGSTNRASLSWSASSNAVSYRIERRVWSNGSWNTAGNTSNTSFSENWRNDEDVYYRVFATNSAGQAQASPPDIEVCSQVGGTYPTPSYPTPSYPTPSYPTPSPANYTVSGFVYEDLNTTTCCGGVKDKGEDGLKGRTVYWRTSGGSVVETTTTNGNGAYSFTVPAGNHRFSHDVPPGWNRTTDDSVPVQINGNWTHNFGVYNPNSGSGLTFGVTYSTLNPPTNISVNNSVCDQLAVNWSYTSNANENHFTVWRSTSSGSTGSQISGIIPKNQFSFTDTNTTANTSYWYTVKAHTIIGGASESASTQNGPTLALGCSANLANSSMILSAINGKPYSSSTLIKDTDILTFNVIINNAGPGNATINRICATPSANITNLRNLSVSGGGTGGGITPNSPACTGNTLLDVTGVKPVGGSNWVVAFDSTFSSQTSDQFEVCRNSANINYTDSEGNKGVTKTFGPFLCKTNKGGDPNFIEVAP